MQAVDTDFEDSGLARLANRGVDFLTRFFDHLLDASGMNAPVQNQLLQRNSRHLAADRIKAREDDCFRRVVDDEVNARRRFQRADVASLAADDAALHVVVRQRHNGNRGFRNVIRGAALDRQRDDVPRALVRFLFGFGLDVANEDCGFVPRVPLYVGKQHVAGVFRGETRNLFQFVELLVVKGAHGCFHFFDLSLAHCDGGFALVERIGLFIENLLSLKNAPFVSLNLSAALAVFSFRFGANFKYFFFCF